VYIERKGGVVKEKLKGLAFDLGYDAVEEQQKLQSKTGLRT
jgi:hypothetical protein